MKRKHYLKTLKIKKDDLCKYERLLAGENWNYEELGVSELSTIKTWTVVFDDGCFIDLKINSNQRMDGDFYSEVVLFAPDGSQLDYSEAQYDLKGIWNVSSADTDYSIEVKED